MQVTITAEFDNVDLAERALRALKRAEIYEAGLGAGILPECPQKKPVGLKRIVLNIGYMQPLDSSTTYSYTSTYSYSVNKSISKAYAQKICLSLSVPYEMISKAADILINHGGR